MSFFEVEKPRPLIPSGEHVLALREIVRKSVTSKFARTEDGRTEKLMWRFEAAQLDPDGEPFEFVTFTGSKYGNERAALTELLDLIVPGMNIEIAKSLDPNSLLHRRFRAIIRHRRDEQANKVYAHLHFAEPLTSPPTQPDNASGAGGEP